MPCPKGIQSVTQPRANVFICSQNWRCAQLHGLCDWIILSRNATCEVHSSLLVTSILCDHILSQDHEYGYEIIANQLEAKALVCQENNVKTSADTEKNMQAVLLQRAVDLAKEKESSTWLTALPLVKHGFALHKGAFHDALALRYGWTPSEIPSMCICRSTFSVEHALSCDKGGFPSIRPPTWWPPYSMRCATTCVLSQVYSLSWRALQPTTKTVLG